MVLLPTSVLSLLRLASVVLFKTDMPLISKQLLMQVKARDLGKCHLSHLQCTRRPLKHRVPHLLVLQSNLNGHRPPRLLPQPAIATKIYPLCHRQIYSRQHMLRLNFLGGASARLFSLRNLQRSSLFAKRSTPRSSFSCAVQ